VDSSSSCSSESDSHSEEDPSEGVQRAAGGVAALAGSLRFDPAAMMPGARPVMPRAALNASQASPPHEEDWPAEAPRRPVGVQWALPGMERPSANDAAAVAAEPALLAPAHRPPPPARDPAPPQPPPSPTPAPPLLSAQSKGVGLFGSDDEDELFAASSKPSRSAVGIVPTPWVAPPLPSAGPAAVRDGARLFSGGDSKGDDFFQSSSAPPAIAPLTAPRLSAGPQLSSLFGDDSDDDDGDGLFG